MKKYLSGTAFSPALATKSRLLKLTFGFSSSFCAITTLYAATIKNHPTTLKTNTPQVYWVKKGDTLWDIAQKCFNHQQDWPEIWANNKHIKNPHRIFPADRLDLYQHENGRMIDTNPSHACQNMLQDRLGQPRIHLHPQIRIEKLNNSIQSISLKKIQPWLTRHTIVATDKLHDVPYVVAIQEQRLMAAKGQYIYVRGQNLNLNQRYAIYRPGQAYLHHNHQGEKINLGIELAQIASAIAIDQHNQITTLVLTDSYHKEVMKNDLVFTEQQSSYPTEFHPVAATGVDADAKIIHIHGNLKSAAKHSLVTINRGTQHGIKIGQLFSVYQTGQEVKDAKNNQSVQLPTEEIAQLMVVQTFAQLSYGYILDHQRPINQHAILKAVNLDD